MKVILQNDVRDLGSVGDVVNVAAGYARNFLFPRQLAAPATEKRMKELAHFQKLAEKKKVKIETEKKSLVEKINGTTVSFERKAGDEDKLFGSVTNADIAAELVKAGFAVDKRDIVIADPIKVLGQHKAVYHLSADLEAEIKVNVERLA